MLYFLGCNAQLRRRLLIRLYIIVTNTYYFTFSAISLIERHELFSIIQQNYGGLFQYWRGMLGRLKGANDIVPRVEIIKLP